MQSWLASFYCRLWGRVLVFFACLGITLACATIALVKLGFILIGNEKNPEYLSMCVALIFGTLSVWVKAPSLNRQRPAIADISPLSSLASPV